MDTFAYVRDILIAFTVLCGLGATLPLAVKDEVNRKLLAWIGSLASLAVLLASGKVLFSGGTFVAHLWTLPALGVISLKMDRLSAVFLFVFGLVFLATSTFSAGYLRRFLGHYSLKSFSAFYFGLFFFIVLVPLARDVLLFLFAWEMTSVTSYLLTAFEHREDESRRGAYVMLAQVEGGYLAFAVAFLVLAGAAGSLDFGAMKAAGAGLDEGVRWAVFLLAFFGFGVKAGLVPFNMWLPRAHPVAPANMSALLSGVLVNMGFYGFTRVLLDLLPPVTPGPGLVVMGIGAASAILGILYAVVDRDLKALLAHSTIENMGIATTALGAGLVFQSYGQPVLATMAVIVGLYHMGNHGVYKALLFMGAGAVDMHAGTRDINRLGGLARFMPWTSVLFLVGTLAISAMPPLSGFVSEWLTLQVLLQGVHVPSVTTKIGFALAGVVLALTAALAITAFVKVYAMTFLGMPRSPQVAKNQEAAPSMLAGIGLLAVLALVMGLTPTYLIPVLDHAVASFTGATGAGALVPPFFSPGSLPPSFAQDFGNIGAQVLRGIIPGLGLVVMHRGAGDLVVFAMSTFYAFWVILLFLAVVFIATRLLVGRRKVVRQPQWDGGIRRLRPQMTYTATGFSNPVRVVFNAVLHPRSVEERAEVVGGHFRIALHRSYEEVHILDRFVLQPLIRGAYVLGRLIARMHEGSRGAFAGYVLAALVAVLIAAAVMANG